jgi:hypothetical protein
MITLSFLKLLEDEGFGEIDVDLFFQKLTLDKKGIYIADIGDPGSRHSRDTQSYELLARGKTDLDGSYKLSQIRKFLVKEYQNICELPAMSIKIEGETVNIPAYTNIELSEPSTITNVGLDAQNRIIYSMTGTIIYKEK